MSLKTVIMNTMLLRGEEQEAFHRRTLHTITGGNPLISHHSILYSVTQVVLFWIISWAGKNFEKKACIINYWCIFCKTDSFIERGCIMGSFNSFESESAKTPKVRSVYNEAICITGHGNLTIILYDYMYVLWFHSEASAGHLFSSLELIWWDSKMMILIQQNQYHL